MDTLDVLIINEEIKDKHLGQPFTVKELYDRFANPYESYEFKLEAYSSAELKTIEEYFLTEIDFGCFRNVELLGQNRQKENVYAKRQLN